MEPTPAAKSLQNAFRLSLIDLEALPEDAYTTSLGGTARTVADIVHELIQVNDSIVRDLRREPNVPWPHKGWIVAPEDRRTKEASLAAFRASAERAVTTVDAYTPEELEETVQTEEGEAKREAQVRFMVLHLWYHLGQINFVQTLLGDDAWHWNAP